jgi:putative membrane protein
MHHRLRRSTAAAGVALAVSAIAVYACKEHGGSTDPKEVTSGIANSTRSDADILGLMHEANRAEIQAGQLATQRSSNADVKSFGTTMVAEHTTLDAEVDALAAQLKISPTVPSDELAKLQNSEISGISGLAANNFGYHYMALQVTAHERTLALVDAFIAKAQQAALRTALQNDVRPHIVVHLAAAQQLKGRIGGP